MNDKPLQLTDYQQATLTEMGITWWRKIDESESDTAQQHIQTPQSQASTADVTDAIAKLRQAASKQEPEKAAEKPQPQSLTDKVLVTSAELPNHRILLDVLAAFELDINMVVHHPNQPLSAFCDYQLAWQLGECVDLKDRMLTAPVSLDGSAKKALWALISKDEH